VTPRSDVVGYRRFGGPCGLHVQGEVRYLKFSRRRRFNSFLRTYTDVGSEPKRPRVEFMVK